MFRKSVMILGLMFICFGSLLSNDLIIDGVILAPGEQITVSPVEYDCFFRVELHNIVYFNSVASDTSGDGSGGGVIQPPDASYVAVQVSQNNNISDYNYAVFGTETSVNDTGWYTPSIENNYVKVMNSASSKYSVIVTVTQITD